MSNEHTDEHPMLRLQRAVPWNEQDVRDLPRDVLPAVIAKLTRLLGIMAERLHTGGELPAVEPAAEHDALLNVDEAAQLIGRSVRWLRQHGHTLPGFSQPQGKGTTTYWSRSQLRAWLTADAD